MSTFGLSRNLTIRNNASSSKVSTDGLKLWHKMDAQPWSGSNRMPDSSPVGTNTGALYTGRALDFDGVNDTVDIGNTGQTIKSLVFYVNPDTDTQKFLELQTNGAVDVGCGAGILTTMGWSSPATYVNGVPGSTITAGTWQQVVITSATGISANAVTLGKSNIIYFAGQMTDVRLYSVELSSAQVAELYANPENALPAGVSSAQLVGWWKLDRGVGTAVADYSNTKKPGTISGAVWVVNTGLCTPQRGVIDHISSEVSVLDTIDFASAGSIGYQSVTIADNPSLDVSTAFTLEAWVRLRKTGAAQSIISKNLAFNFRVNSSNKIELEYWGAGVKYTATANTALRPWRWYHCAVTFDGNTIKFYIDTVLDATVVASVAAIDTNANDVHISTFAANSQQFQGNIDEPKIYANVLSSSQISSNFNVQKNAHVNASSVPAYTSHDASAVMSYINSLNITQTQDINLFGSLSGSAKWYGGVLAPNGKIYCIPYQATTILVIDPDTNTVSQFGSLSGSAKWIGGVLAPNGKIYGIPYNSTAVLEIDPDTNTTSQFGSLSGSAKWCGGVLAPNGKIYCIPLHATTILVIDPDTNTVSQFGSISGSAKWFGGVLAPNGKIYGIPYGATAVLEIDPDTNTVSQFGSLSGTFKWIGGVLAPNGKIYGIPYGATTVLEIDPDTNTVSEFGSLSGSAKWIGGVLAPNGKIYGIPYGATTVLEILSTASFDTNLPLSRFFSRL